MRRQNRRKTADLPNHSVFSLALFFLSPGGWFVIEKVSPMRRARRRAAKLQGLRSGPKSGTSRNTPNREQAFSHGVVRAVTKRDNLGYCQVGYDTVGHHHQPHACQRY